MTAPAPTLRSRLHAALAEGGLGVVLAAVLGSRLLLLIAGLITQHLRADHMAERYVWRYHDNPLWDLWGVLDTGWYLGIVEHGYHTVIDPGVLQTNHVFFPAYPLICRLLTPLVGHPLVAGVVVSNLCFIGALLLLWRLVRDRHGAGVATATVSVAALFPGSYVYSSMYTESLFLLLLLGCIHYATRDRWLMVGVLGALLSATRFVGLVAVLPLALLWVERHGLASLRRPSSWLRLAALGLVPLGTGLYMLFLDRLVGNPTAFLDVQAGWDRAFQSPLVPLLAPLTQPTLYNLYQWAFGAACFAALIPIARRRLWPELTLALCLLGVPLLNGAPYAPLESYARYTIVAYPVFVGLALAVGERPRLRLALLVALAAVNVAMMTGWAVGSFFVM